ncbi:phospholysine phosphohistidine inorganic pyrophosphate phosphatase-like isoform X1 [Montipora capricornis]|uniref:phospholysine phosphohistidine inorganic pyrophosphate phosphatase-like isoform X1 n=1 Tax=Montipora capricornis TaxID=246305 RepID=UPI0035F119B7
MAAGRGEGDERPGWLSKKIQGILLDITGVLYNSGEGSGYAIQGSVEAVKKLKAAGYKVRFCTNEDQCTRQQLVNKLGHLGFSLSAHELFSPCPIGRKIIQERNLRPFLLIHPGGLPEFEELDCHEPNCVVIGGAEEHFTYENMNRAFRVLINSENPVLLATGYGRYYKSGSNLTLDVGPYTKALEFACDVKAEILGKPAASFFLTALADINVFPEDAVMIGDDIVSDVGGAQACNIRGVQVRTGKFRLQVEHHPIIKPIGYVNDLAEAVDLILRYN